MRLEEVKRVLRRYEHLDLFCRVEDSRMPRVVCEIDPRTFVGEYRKQLEELLEKLPAGASAVFVSPEGVVALKRTGRNWAVVRDEVRGVNYAVVASEDILPILLAKLLSEGVKGWETRRVKVGSGYAVVEIPG